MQSLELKLPPPVLAALLAVSMWLSSFCFAPMRVPFVFRLGFALAIGALGTAIGLVAKLSFARAGTSVNPLRPDAATEFICSGVYRLSRNPMYLGRALQLLAWAVYLCNPVAVLFVPVFVLYLSHFQIRPEERVLSERFGAEYMNYLSRVPRWL